MTQAKPPQDDPLLKKVEELKKEEETKAEELNKEQELRQKVEGLTDKLARALADLQNYKRRAEEDRARFIKFSNAELLKTLIPIMDNFDRSVKHLPEELKTNEWAKGAVAVHDDLLKALEAIGVKKMEAVSKKLDPNFHEAVMTAPGEKDIIIEELEPGYTYHDETLKPAKVKVGDGNK
ncbi:nucleotide exchange factor GrpE [Candidatus Peregrinibacteria bacterium]|nr:nucleotide exchange factor GrpE [Candidatus Peregrinibacteria bacterium]